eukprot:6212389-Pleurochrysis_carterae.AAC.7
MRLKVLRRCAGRGNRPADSEAHDYTVRGQRQRALWITVPPCASGYQLKKAKEPRNANGINASAKTYKCE